MIAGNREGYGAGEEHVPAQRLERDGRLPRVHLPHRHRHLSQRRQKSTHLRHSQGLPIAQDTQASQVGYRCTILVLVLDATSGSCARC